MKQASYCIALISELRIAVYTRQLHNKIAAYDLQLLSNKLPSTIYNSMATDCRLQSTTPRQQIAAYSLQLHGWKLLPATCKIAVEKWCQKSCPISRKYRRKILQQAAFHSAENTTFNSSLFNSKSYLQSLPIQQKKTTFNSSLFSSKSYLQSLSIQQKTPPSTHIYSAENTGGK